MTPEEQQAYLLNVLGHTAESFGVNELICTCQVSREQATRYKKVMMRFISLRGLS